MAKLVIGNNKTVGVPAIVKKVTEVPNYIAPKNNVNGVYKADNTATTFNLNGATEISEYALYNAFYNCTNLTTVLGLENITTVKPYSCYYAFYGAGITGKIDMSSLVNVNGNSSCSSMFINCTGITSVDLSGVTNLSTYTGQFGSMFSGCAGIISADLSGLTRVGSSQALINMFKNCVLLGSIDLSSLSELTANNACDGMFFGCTSLTSVSLLAITKMTGSYAIATMFRDCTSLTTVRIGNTTTIDFGTQTSQFYNMFQGCTQNIDVYAPAGNQAAIEAMSGYPNFGATGTVTWHWNTAE